MITGARSFLARNVFGCRLKLRTSYAGRGVRSILMAPSASAVLWPYPIGKKDEPWGDEEKAKWRESIDWKRSYAEEVLVKIEALKGDFDVVQYGALPYDASDPAKYPLFALKTKGWSAVRGGRGRGGEGRPRESRHPSLLPPSRTPANLLATRRNNDARRNPLTRLLLASPQSDPRAGSELSVEGKDLSLSLEEIACRAMGAHPAPRTSPACW